MVVRIINIEKSHSTPQCIKVFKKSVEYYQSRVVMCLVATEAYDKVSYF